MAIMNELDRALGWKAHDESAEGEQANEGGDPRGKRCHGQSLAQLLRLHDLSGRRHRRLDGNQAGGGRTLKAAALESQGPLT